MRARQRATEKPDNPIGHEDDDHEDERRHDEISVIGDRPQHLGQQAYDCAANETSPKRSDPADDRARQREDRKDDAVAVRVDDAQSWRAQCSGKRKRRGTEDEADNEVRSDRNAKRARRDLVGREGSQIDAKRALQQGGEGGAGPSS